jgi:3-oxoadipate enol-lactonase
MGDLLYWSRVLCHLTPVGTLNKYGKPPEVEGVPVTSLHYEVQGDGPPVVLIGGGAQLDLRMWDQQVRPLAQSYRVIRYDVRGYGRSSHAHTGEPYQHHEDLYELVGHLGVDRAHFIGLSLGGRISLDLCLEHPEVVRSLVLSGPGVSGFDWPPDDDAAPILDALEAGDPIAAADRWLEHPYMAPSMELPHLRDRLRSLARDNASLQRNTEVELKPPAVGRLSEIHVPTLLLVGTRDVPDIQTIADLLTSQVADLVRIDFEGAGHLPNMEQPERFNREVLNFLAQQNEDQRQDT